MEHHCGEMAEVSEFCHALYWKKEENTSGQYAKCCHGGKVRLRELTQTPNLLLDLLTGNSLDSKNYRTYIREYHAALAFASMGARPTSGRVVTLETGRREAPGSNPGHACRPSCSEFSVIFSETSVNTG